jgi:DNA-binding response OmpR family regulator
MRILLVEDNITFAKSIERELVKIADCEVIWAKSRDTALAHLADTAFDLERFTAFLNRGIPWSGGL